VTELTFALHHDAPLFLFKELHGHGLSPIHVLFQIINDFLVLHFWAESFLSAVNAVCSVLLLVGPHVFNAHVGTKQLVFQLLLAKVVDARFLI
jgi:hypothetical protein